MSRVSTALHLTQGRSFYIAFYSIKIIPQDQKVLKCGLKGIASPVRAALSGGVKTTDYRVISPTLGVFV
jgi:hypothetical protein